MTHSPTYCDQSACLLRCVDPLRNATQRIALLCCPLRGTQHNERNDGSRAHSSVIDAMDQTSVIDAVFILPTRKLRRLTKSSDPRIRRIAMRLMRGHIKPRREAPHTNSEN